VSAETWRVVCADGVERAAEVLPWSGACGGWCAFLPGTGNGEMGANERAAVAALAGREGWPVVAIVGPGEATPDERVAAEREACADLIDATETWCVNNDNRTGDTSGHASRALRSVARRIRARGAA
jgi:hypothetical protein